MQRSVGSPTSSTSSAKVAAARRWQKRWSKPNVVLRRSRWSWTASGDVATRCSRHRRWSGSRLGSRSLPRSSSAEREPPPRCFGGCSARSNWCRRRATSGGRTTSRRRPSTPSRCSIPQTRRTAETAVRILRVGGADRDRTDDLLNAIQALSQLSYGPTGRHFVAKGGGMCQSTAALPLSQH